MDRRARALDAGVGLAAAGALLIEGASSPGALPAAAYPLAVATGAAVLVWRQRPLLALLGVEAGCIACVEVFGAGGSATALVMLALFTAALRGDRQRSLIAGALTAVALVVTIVSVDESPEATTVALRLVLLLAAVAAGDVVRSRQALAVAERDRRRHLEREREEQASRAITQERLRIARDLHDTLAHSLVAINVRAGVAAHLGGTGDPAAALVDIKEVSAQALQDLRTTLHLLREPAEEEGRDPVSLSGLQSLVNHARAGGLDAELTVRVDERAVSTATAQAAYRIVQEALTNVLRHARAASASVSLTGTASTLEIRVVDDGRGAPLPVSTSGHGLRGMAERATALGGHVSTGPAPDGGWQVEAELPLQATTA